MVAQEPGTIVVVVSGRPDAVTVDLLARLQLRARRLGHRVQLVSNSCELQELLTFFGLRDVLPCRCEPGVERRAEPLSALFLPADRWPGALLDVAWLEVIRNSAHDSICACSHDDVCRAVLHRFSRVRGTADAGDRAGLNPLGDEGRGQCPQRRDQA